MLIILLSLFAPAQEPATALRSEITGCLEVLVEAIPAKAPQEPESNAALEQCLAALLDHVALSADPATRRKAGFLALGYLLDRHDQLQRAPGLSSHVEDLVPEKERLALRTKALMLKLHGRQDLAAHFFVGAALECMLGERHAGSVGQTKELWDAARLATGQGTGFSFQDLCAHDAGIQFSKHLSQHWDRLRAGKPLVLVDWMPFVDDLAEGLTTEQIQNDYGGPRGDRFKIQQKNLRGRILTCDGYRDLRRDVNRDPLQPMHPIGHR